MTGEFLLEIGTEEIPAGFMPPALQAIDDLFTKAMTDARIGFGAVETYGTPRRLILRVSDVESMQASREIERTGPPKSRAYDENGNPTKAALGFAKSQGIDVSELVLVETAKGEQVAVRKTEEGKPTIEALSEIVPSLIERIPFPKSMRWMDLDVRFARPIHWIVALYDGQTVPLGFGNIKSGSTSYGHRFTHPDGFIVASFGDLERTLAGQGVVIDPDARLAALKNLIESPARDSGLHVFDDPELLREVNYLVESPYPIMGEFTRDFLELPASILITVMKKHQRYFSLQGSDGRITNRFIAVNNTPVKDPAVSVKGHQRVLKARLEDARFYFHDDRKRPLIDRLDDLKGVVFHSKLGTSYEKAQRFTRLAVLLAEQFYPDERAKVERAALLAKCDLETGIVYEFPELQGIIGSYYALMDGEDEAVADAIREHYLPAHAGDDLPVGIIGALVSIADRIDTICGCFSVGLIPTGTADPYALRRHALAVIQILMELDIPLSLRGFVREAGEALADKRTRPADEVEHDVMEFIATRFLHFHTSRDFPLDVVEAVVRARFDDVADARRRVVALRTWKQREDFDAIIVGFKRVVNILKGAEPGELSEDLLMEQAEKDLARAFAEVRAEAAPLIEKGDYAAALEAAANLKAPIDRFFDDVMVMVEDKRLRENRLALLSGIAEFFSQIADFSFIGSTAETK